MKCRVKRSAASSSRRYPPWQLYSFHLCRAALFLVMLYLYLPFSTVIAGATSPRVSTRANYSIRQLSKVRDRWVRFVVVRGQSAPRSGQFSATIDQSDIRGSEPHNLDRRELPLTVVASPAEPVAEAKRGFSFVLAPSAARRYRHIHFPLCGRFVSVERWGVYGTS